MYLQPQQKNSCGSFEIWMNNKLELKTSPALERFLCYHNCVYHFQLVHIVNYVTLPFSQPHPCSRISPITSSLSCFFSTMHLSFISNINNTYFSSFQQHNCLFVSSKLQAMEKPNILLIEFKFDKLWRWGFVVKGNSGSLGYKVL